MRRGSDRAGSNRTAQTTAAGFARSHEGDEAALEAAYREALDLDNWVTGARMYALEDRLERFVEEAARYETDMAPRIRARVQEMLREQAAVPEAGIHEATREEVLRAHRRWLLSGEVEACDGTRVSHESAPVTVHQIGVCLTSYARDGQSVGHRLYRHDIRRVEDDPEAELDAFMRRRAGHEEDDVVPGEGGDNSDEAPSTSSLLARAIMTYAERAMLLRRSTATWRLGHGHAIPYELIIGASDQELVRHSLPLLKELLLGHQRFLFVPSRVKDRAIKTIADALRPMEYAVIGDTRHVVRGYLKGSYQRPLYAKIRPEIEAFGEAVAPSVVQCVYRASPFAPGHIFYAHRDHVHEAARIVIANSLMQEHRGFPQLIDLADELCRHTFSAQSLAAAVEATFARMYQPFQHLPERSTRRR